MTRLKQTAAYLCASLIVTAGCHLHAFEQGTFFIYQLVEQKEAQAIENRLTINAKLFTQKDKAVAKAAEKPSDRSEFEMDYNSFGTTTNSGFNSSTATKIQTPSSTDTSAFNLTPADSTTSIFGN